MFATGIDGLYALRDHSPATLAATLSEPVTCLVLQGRKETWLGDRHARSGPGDTLIVSHHLPIVSRVVEASSEHSYIALVQAMGRLFDLVNRPLEAKVMAPLILREIHFRLLLARHGGMLRQLLRQESAASRISKAIGRIRQDFRTQVAVPDLARTAGMSASSFHEHFRTLTATTPLQYQKDLRLIEARQLLIDGTRSVSNVAFEVGYESPTQFSREYSRKFGVSPRRDLAGLRANA